MPLEVAAAVTVEIIERPAHGSDEAKNYRADDPDGRHDALRRAREAEWKRWDDAISGRAGVLDEDEKARQLAELYASMGFGGANSLGDGS